MGEKQDPNPVRKLNASISERSANAGGGMCPLLPTLPSPAGSNPTSPSLQAKVAFLPSLHRPWLSSGMRKQTKLSGFRAGRVVGERALF